MPNQNAEDHVVRHSGRAHIRGKIRRVWRPRYLELMDNGFVRYFECENTSADSSDDHENMYHVSMSPKCTLKIYHARIIDVTTLRDVHVGLPRGTYGFLFHGLKASVDDGCGRGSMNDSPTARDFLCAVATLEEAQSWVVALQWATSLRTGDWQGMDDDLYSATSTTVARYPQVKGPTLVTVREKNLNNGNSPKKKPFVGKTVVPKIQSVDIIRETGTSMVMAYKIHLLVLQKKEGSPIEERHLLRTRSEINLLLKRLVRDLGSNEDVKVRSLQEKFDMQRPTSYQDYVRSVSGVDLIIRTLAMDVNICNSTPLRTFWSLDHFCQQRHWDIHRSDSVLKLCHHQPQSTDSFVKQWLQERNYEQQSIIREYLYSILLKKQIGIVWILVLVFVLLRPVGFINHYFGSVKVSLDVFILSILVAVWVGKELEKRRIIESTREKTRKVASTKDSIHVSDMSEEICSDLHSVSTEEDPTEQSLDYEADENPLPFDRTVTVLSSPLPKYPDNGGVSCWSKPKDRIFHVRSASYLRDRAKEPSGPAPFDCRGVDIWLTDNPERNIARHPDIMGGCLEEEDTFLVNFLLPFGNLVAYFRIPPLEDLPPKVGKVWSKFIAGDQEYRDARLKLLPVVVEGPWIVKTAVGTGKSPALLGKVIPLQYYFRHATENRNALYEVDIIITASSIAKGILSVVKGHTRSLTIALGFIIEAAEEEELPESVLCNFQLHELNLEDCPQLPDVDLNAI